MLIRKCKALFERRSKRSGEDITKLNSRSKPTVIITNSFYFNYMHFIAHFDNMNNKTMILNEKYSQLCSRDKKQIQAVVYLSRRSFA
jgi:hypothetical protein